MRHTTTTTGERSEPTTWAQLELELPARGFACSGFARTIVWRLAQIEERPPRAGDADTLAGLLMELPHEAPYLPRDVVRRIAERITAAAQRPGSN